MIKRVLIVDDSPMIHGLLKKTLMKNGYEVCGDAKNGQEGVELHKSLSPDVTFMDVTMPILDGIEALKLILEYDSSAKVIMLTAMADDEIISQAESLGASVFLKKPFNEEMIISAILKCE